MWACFYGDFFKVFILLINILIFGLFEHIKQKNSEIAELTLQNQRDADSVEYYKALVSQDEKQKVLIHDIKKHLNAIASLNEQHDSEKIAAYLTHVLGSSELKHSVRVEVSVLISWHMMISVYFSVISWIML